MLVFMYISDMKDVLILLVMFLWSTIIVLSILKAFFQICWIWIFPWISFSWYPCLIQDKNRDVNWLQYFLHDELASVDSKECFDSCMVWQFIWRSSFYCKIFLLKTQMILLYAANWLYFVHCIVSFFTLDHHLFFGYSFWYRFMKHMQAHVNHPLY